MHGIGGGEEAGGLRVVARREVGAWKRKGDGKGEKVDHFISGSLPPNGIFLG